MGGGKKLRDNERLEFLGDRVLGLLTAERLCVPLVIAGSRSNARAPRETA